MLATRSNDPHAGEVSTFTAEVAPNDFGKAGGDGASKKRGGLLAMRHVALGVCVALLLAAWPVSSDAQIALTTVAAGTDPGPVVVNPVTNRIYVPSFQDGNVRVIDGSTGAAIATVTVASPGAIAVNTVTNKIYVADTNASAVTVIDGATNAAGTPITVGTTPITVAVNPITNMIYVGNQSSNNVSVIDGSTNTLIATVALTGQNPQAIGVNPVTNLIYVVNNETSNVSVIDGSLTPQSVVATVNAGSNPLSIGVNAATNLIYVANSGSNTVTVIDGSQNTTASNTTVATGSQPRVLVVNPVSNKIYTANHTSNNVTVIDGFLNSTVTVTVGTQPMSIAVNPTTNQIYVANHTNVSGGGTLSVIDGTLNTTASVVTVPFAAGAFPLSLAVNPVTNQVYAASQSSNDVTVFDGATNLTNTIATGTSSQTNGASIAANPATNKIYVPNSFSNSVTVYNAGNNETTAITTSIGQIPNNAAVNVVTNTIYVTNLADSTVSVIDGSTDTVSAVVATGTSSQTNRSSIAANPVTNKIYVPNSFSNTVTVINGADNTTKTITTGIGMIPNAVAINQVTNKIYVTNLADSTVSVIDGNTDTVSAVVATGTSSQVNGSSIGVNPATNKIYVPNSFSNTVTVIDGATNATTTITAMIGSISNNLAINPVTNRIYVTNLGDATVSVIDGSTDTVSAVVAVGSSSQTNRTSIAVNPATNKIYVPNSFTNSVTVIDGATNTTRTVTPGMISNAVAVNLATNKIYVTNLADSTVTEISEEQVQPIPLVTSIDPLPGNVSLTGTPTFTFTAANSFAANPVFVPGKVHTVKPLFANNPAAPLIASGVVTHVYYQVDTWEGPWIAATPVCGDFSATVASPLRQGTHVVYAYATDGEESQSTGMTQQLVGQITAEVFTVILPGTFTDLNTDNNPAAVGQAVTFTADVGSKTPGTQTGTVTFFDGATSLGSGALVTGEATVTTSALTLGSHAITAVYSGDGSFSGGTSEVLTEVITTSNPVPVATSLAPTFATAGDATFTLTVNGSNFVSGSVVNWDGVALTTTFVSATQLTASVPASDVVTSGTVPVTVFNPALGGGTSGALTFTINNSVPVISTMSPTSAVGGTATFTLTVNGSSFVSGSTVLWNGVARATTFVSSTQLTATIPSSDLLNSGTTTVQVSNPLPGGGNSVTALTFTVTVPVPVLTTIAPSAAAAGSPAFTMTLTGTSFISTSIAQWNGANLTTTFVSATQLTAQVPAADVLTVGTASVAVLNPVGVAQVVKGKVRPHSVGPSAQTSNALTFTISAGNPLPVLDSMSPGSAVGGTASFTLTVNGSNFVSGSTVTWNGVALTTAFVSSTQLTASIPSTDLLSSGSATVGVSSPLPGGGTAVTTLAFTITVPVPVLTTIAPSSAAAGSSAFTMTLTGNTFISTSVARWNGVALATTFVSATQLTAQVPAADVLTVGTASVAVFNPVGVAQIVKGKVHPEGGGPSGALSNALTFTINAGNPTPVLTLLSPNFATVGGTSFTLTVTGSGFVSGAIVQWNGMSLVTTFVSATQLTAVVPVGDLTAVGTASVTVLNPTPGGGESNAATENIDTVTTTTTITVSPTPPVAGQPITFTVTIAPPPTGSSLGTVRILNGATLLGTVNVNSSGVATFTTSALAAGSNSIIAVYSGNATSGASSVELDITVNAGAGFSVTAPQTPFALAQGGAVSIPIAVPPVGAPFNSVVTMSATGLPPGATGSFNPAMVTPGPAGATTVLTIQLAGAAGSITPMARGPRAPLAPQEPFPAIPAAALTLGLVTLGFIVTYRRPRALRLAFATVAFAGAVILFAGCNGGFSGGQRTTPGNYTVTVTGTSGAQHVSTTVTLAVQ